METWHVDCSYPSDRSSVRAPAAGSILRLWRRPIRNRVELPILQEDTPPPIIIRAHFANSDGIWATEGTDQLYELCKVMSNRPGDFVRQQIFRYGAYCGWLGENREWALPGSTPTSQNGVPILDPVQAWVEDGMRWPPLGAATSSTHSSLQSKAWLIGFMAKASL